MSLNNEIFQKQRFGSSGVSETRREDRVDDFVMIVRHKKETID